MRYYIGSPGDSLQQGIRSIMSAFKSLVRDFYSWWLYRLGLSHPSRIASDSLLILTFHRVLPCELRSEYPLPGLAVTPEELRWILASLLPHFETLAVSDAVRKHRAGPGPRPLLAISFDDGQWDNLEYAAPVLAELGVPATFYLPTDFIGRQDLLWHDQAAFAWQASAKAGKLAIVADALNPGSGDASGSVGAFLEAMKQLAPQARTKLLSQVGEAAGVAAPGWARLMDWTEVNRLSELGHEIGSHGCSHALLPQLDREGQRAELKGSMDAVEQFTARKPVSICYPNGSFNEMTLTLAEEVGYENAVTTLWGINDRAACPFRLLRCDMDAGRLVDRKGALSSARLAMRVSGKQPGLVGH